MKLGGKSAILTAITLCLGAKSSTTHRGSSLKSFIKENERKYKYLIFRTSEISIVLSNYGPESYKPELYGDEITIQRIISANPDKPNQPATSSFKIKGAAGTTISTLKGEVANITDHMDIHADNPLVILSQDVAKKFLKSSNDEDKYQVILFI